MDLGGVIRAGDGLVLGQACAEPQTLVEALVAQRAALGGVSAFFGVNYSGLIKPAHADHLRLRAYCGAGHNRALADSGVLDILPLPYSRLGEAIRARRIRADVVLLQVSPPNARGEYSLGLAAEYLVPALATCRAVVAEVNDQVPWTHGDRVLRREDIALLVESSRAPVALPYGAAGELERAIARNAAPFVPDRATIELGLGVLPDAVLAALAGHRDLGIHSGTVTDSVATLMRSGAITNAHKGIDAGCTVGGACFGTRALFDFVHENPAFELRSCEYTHSPSVLGSLERFVAINSAVEVDLTGQVNAEIAGGSYVGAVGGALDFIRAANQSRGGVSLVCLPSAVGTKVSRIVAKLSGPVATPRSEAGVFVTEHGAADLRGRSLAEREPLMTGIAHPAFRARLEQEADALGLGK